MKIIYNKLIRDGVPAIIEQNKHQCELAVLPEEEFIPALLAKLIEEAQELADAPREALVGELADVSEILECLKIQLGVSDEQLSAARDAKRKKSGGFERRLKLIWADDGK